MNANPDSHNVWLTQGTIKVVVGPADETTPGTEFTVHEGLISGCSRFFANALQPDRWVEGQTKIVRLIDATPDIFTMYVSRLYYPNEFFKDYGKGSLPYDDYLADLAVVYVLAEMLVDERTKSDMLQLMETTTSQESFNPIAGRMEYVKPSINVIKTIYSGTTAGNPARAFVVMCFTKHAGGDSEYFRDIYNQDTDNLPPEFLHDLNKGLLVWCNEAQANLDSKEKECANWQDWAQI